MIYLNNRGIKGIFNRNKFIYHFLHPSLFALYEGTAESWCFRSVLWLEKRVASDGKGSVCVGKMGGLGRIWVEKSMSSKEQKRRDLGQFGVNWGRFGFHSWRFWSKISWFCYVFWPKISENSFGYMSSASKGEKQINKHNGILHILTKKRYM